jgi:hypothetical protein
MVAGPLVALVLGGAVGCTDDESPSSEPPPSSVADLGTGRAPEVFGRAAPDGWSWVGATDDVLVGLGGSPDDVDGYGQVVDLATGTVLEIDPLPEVDGRPSEATAAAFRADDVVVTGFLPPEHRFPESSDMLPDYEAVSFRLDPDDGSWHVLDGLELGLGTGREARLGLVGDDALVARFPRGGYPPASERARLDGDRWEAVSGSTAEDEAQAGDPAQPACATAREAWEGVMAGDGASDRIAAIALDDGTERVVDVPGFRSNSIHPPVLGCAADLVVVGQMDGPDAVEMLAATTDGGETWTDLTARLPEGPIVLGEMVSGGEHGLLVHTRRADPDMAGDGAAGDGAAGGSLVVAADGTAALLDGAADSTTPVVWRGHTGDLLALEPATDPDDPITIRTLDPP